MSVENWVRHHEMTGGRFFTFEGLGSALPEMSNQVLRNSLGRLKRAHRIYSPYRGFFVILPPEYVLRGGVPPVYYVDDLMRFWGRSYYFGLLSAASFWGAAHQRPQVDFVAIANGPMFAGKRERRDVRWIVRPKIPEDFVLVKKGEAGPVRYSNAELTALDLVQYASEVGGLSVVATLLSELLESTNFANAAEGVFCFCKGTTIQRLGYIVEKVLNDEKQGEAIYEEWRRTGHVAHFVPLDQGVEINKAHDRDSLWKIVVNTTIEVDDL